MATAIIGLASVAVAMEGTHIAWAAAGAKPERVKHCAQSCVALHFSDGMRSGILPHSTPPVLPPKNAELPPKPPVVPTKPHPPSTSQPNRPSLPDLLARIARYTGPPPPRLPDNSSGIDLAWPKSNCNTVNLKVYTARYNPKLLLVDVNGGQSFTTNERDGNPNNSGCFTWEVAQAKAAGAKLALYVNADNNHANYDKITARPCKPNQPNYKDCQAYNYGYSAGEFAVAFATSNKVYSNEWEEDVEGGNSWDGSLAEHRSSLRGEMDAIKKYEAEAMGVSPSSIEVGFYSTSHMWDEITGGWHNKAPNWYATAQGSAADALAYCHGHDFTGGGTEYVQWQDSSHVLDLDTVCPRG